MTARRQPLRPLSRPNDGADMSEPAGDGEGVEDGDQGDEEAQQEEGDDVDSFLCHGNVRIPK